jgi:hypothetical protein
LSSIQPVIWTSSSNCFFTSITCERRYAVPTIKNQRISLPYLD